MPEGVEGEGQEVGYHGYEEHEDAEFFAAPGAFQVSPAKPDDYSADA